MAKESSRHSSFISSSKSIKFIIKLIVFAAIIICYMAMLIPQYKHSYFASLGDKVNRLKSIDEAKIVLIGNSNVAFGYDSEMLQSEMGMPVVNMGFHGGLGNAFHENMMDYNVAPGDIYVVSHVTYWRNTGKIESPIDAWATLENNTALWHLVKKEDYRNMLSTFPAYIKKCVTRHISLEDMNVTSGVYSRESFNEYGDNATVRVHEDRDYPQEVSAPITDVEEFKALNEWNSYLNERGAKLVIAGYPIMYSRLNVDDEYMDTYQKDLETGFECAVISDWRDYAYPDEYFYDTEYHLTTEGAKIRTKQLISDLKNYLQ